MSKNSTLADGGAMHFQSIGTHTGGMLIARSLAYKGGLVLTASDDTDGQTRHSTVWLAREDIITLVHHLSGMLMDKDEDGDLA